MNLVPGVQNSRKLNGGAPEGWAHVTPAQAKPVGEPQPRVPVFGIVSTWNDADIIWANVKNCLSQGFDEVFVIDNASTDGTVIEASQAGATIARVYETEFYDDDLRIRIENNVANELVRKHQNCWVVSLDSDEFVGWPDRGRVADTLNTLPRQIRCVGSYAWDLYPESEDAYQERQHPALCMPRGTFRQGVWCFNLHWKHPAIRYFDGRFDMAQTRGNHKPAVEPGVNNVLEPDFSLPMLHAPLRNRSKMAERLSALCEKRNGVSRADGDNQVTGGNGAVRRWNALNAVYTQQWDRVVIPHSHAIYGRPVAGVTLYPWRKCYMKETK